MQGSSPLRQLLPQNKTLALGFAEPHSIACKGAHPDASCMPHKCQCFDSAQGHLQSPTDGHKLLLVQGIFSIKLTVFHQYLEQQGPCFSIQRACISKTISSGASDFSVQLWPCCMPLTVYLLVSKKRCILSNISAQLVHLQGSRFEGTCHLHHIGQPKSLT